MTDKVREIRVKLNRLADPVRAEQSKRYFKAFPGGYGEGDSFIGVPVPMLRRVAREYRGLPADDAFELLRSPVHEERLLALFILTARFDRGDEAERKEIYETYLANTRHVNNWDLVDASAGRIVGVWLGARSRAPIHELARSSVLWERRIAIMATFPYIRQGDFSETLKVAEVLLADPEDLVHKAVGWMLREVAKREMAAAERFLKRHYRQMPRVMLRYAIERFPEPRRLEYLKGRV